MHVVLVANPVKDFTPDAFVELSTAERIGQIQASKLADKLQLDTISKDNPKAVEILLPYTASADGSDDEFAKEAFAAPGPCCSRISRRARHTVRPDC